MTSQERRDWTALRANDAELRRAVSGVLNSEDIRLQEQEESFPATNIERVIRSGHPSDREIIRDKAIERIAQYRDSPALNYLVRAYETILARVDQAIIDDYDQHIEYLLFCIERNKKQYERALTARNPFLSSREISASIQRARARIAEIASQRLSVPSGQERVTDAAAMARGKGETSMILPLAAFCPA